MVLAGKADLPPRDAVMMPASVWAWRAGSRTATVTTGRGWGGARRPDPEPTHFLAETSRLQSAEESAAPAPVDRYQHQHQLHHHHLQLLVPRHLARGGDHGHGAVSHRSAGQPRPGTPAGL